MTVETRYVVIRDNAEVKIFVNKKDADDYDKMLDIASLLSALLEECPVSLTELQRDEISYYLAQNKEKVLCALQMKKANATTNAPAKPSKDS